MRIANSPAHKVTSFYFRVRRGRFASELFGTPPKMQNPADKSGACKSWGRKESLPMILLVLTVFLILLRMRRIRLRIEIDL